MNFLNNLGLVLLTMAGYSIGRILPGKKYQVATELFDGGIIVVLWIGALASGFVGKRFSILLWFGIGILIGSLITLVVRPTLPSADIKIRTEEKRKNIFQKLWLGWKAFAFRMGNFQGRLILLLFYFTIVTPFGIINRFFRDPLCLKKPAGDSFWITLVTSEKEIKDARRQY